MMLLTSPDGLDIAEWQTWLQQLQEMDATDWSVKEAIRRAERVLQLLEETA